MRFTNHMQGESMSFEELNVPKNHVYLFKPQFEMDDGAEPLLSHNGH